MAQAAFSSLIDNDILARCARRRLVPRRNFTTRQRGEHLAGRGGLSTDFADYRDYQEGDDLRHVDWNIFARLQRPYLKVFRLEEERHVALLLDASASMGFFGKWRRALELAAVFGTVGLASGERCSAQIHGMDAKRPMVLPACTGKASLKRLLQFLEGHEAAGAVPLDEAVRGLLARHRGRGVCVVCSDFLTPGDLDRAVGRLAAAGLETFALQIMAEEERDPALSGDWRLVDSETGAELDVSAAALAGLYAEHAGGYIDHVRAVVAKHRGRHALIDPRAPLDTVLADTLIRQGWLR